MTDTITDSFCERCGTRYTFEKAARPRRVRLGRVRVLTRGLTTFVANDGLPMAEAMAVARNDVERAELSRQLEVFHKTFNFCMTCRQYTCPSCWNETAAECLTCAPDLSREILPPAFPDLPVSGPTTVHDPDAEAALAAAAWPSADLDRMAAAEPAAIEVAEVRAAEPESVLDLAVAAPEPEMVAEPPVAAPEPEMVAEPPVAAPEPEMVAEPAVPAAPEPEMVAEPPVAAPEPEMVAEPPVAAPEPEMVAEPAVPAAPEPEMVAEPAVPAAPEPEMVAEPPVAAPEPAIVAEPAVPSEAGATPTPALDVAVPSSAVESTELTADELAEIEGALAVARAEAPRSDLTPAQVAPVVPGAEPVPGVAPVVPGAERAADASEAGTEMQPAADVAASPPEPAPAGPAEPQEQVAVARDRTRSLLRRFRPGRAAVGTAAVAQAGDGAPPPHPERGPVPGPAPAEIAAEPEVATGAPDAVPTMPAPEAAAEPARDRPRGDRIQQPTWQMVAPDAPPPGEADVPGTGPEPTPPTAWPTTPGWSSQPAAQVRGPGPDASPWAARLAASRPETGGVWAASSREVLGAPVAPGATPAVRACVSCGLSLSATARFCRRCGARQA